MMLIVYLSVHVTYYTASTTVRVIKIATVDVHVHTRLITVVHVKKITKIITTYAEINKELS